MLVCTWGDHAGDRQRHDIAGAFLVGGAPPSTGVGSAGWTPVEPITEQAASPV